MKTFHLTKNDVQEVLHKMNVLADTEDLQDDYGLTQQQADLICDSIPFEVIKNGGGWLVEDWMLPAIIGEMQDHAVMLRSIAGDARAGNEIGQALAADRQAKKFEEMFV